MKRAQDDQRWLSERRPRAGTNIIETNDDDRVLVLARQVFI